MTIRRTTILAVAAVLLTSPGVLIAAEAPKQSKAQHHRPRHQAAKTVSTPNGAAQYGNNTRDSSYGGVYGENSYKGD